MDNPKKLATPGTQDEDNHPYPSTNKQNNVNKKRSTFEPRFMFDNSCKIHHYSLC